ncbi:MAG TPA: hypothetical protein VHN78_02190 [Chloroflexota bacterium]|nr:hypothetical protein [Chloroflexota bacterium]
MNLRQLYEQSIELGMALDVRGQAGLRAVLDARRREYESLPPWEQATFDLERLRNPFGDVRLVNGPDDVELRTIMLGIDIDVPDLLLADHLRRQGVAVDAVIAHHTTNIGVAPGLAYDIMDVNVDMLVAAGVPRGQAEAVIKPYVDERWRNNEDVHRVGPDTARLLDLPLGCIHTPADYYMEVGIRPAVEAARPQTTADVLRALLTIPEVQSAARFGALPRLMSGEPDWPAGRLFVKTGGGKIFPPGAYPLLGAAGVNTVIQIGCGPEHARAAQEAGVAIVRVPHAACDNIGINLLLDDVVRRRGPLHVIPCRAFERISRLNGPPC